jgi:multiple sugar transport system permease protein
VLAGTNTRTLRSAVCNMLTFEQISWGPLAAVLRVTLPVLLLTAAAQREIVAGLSSGGLMGG